MNNHWFTNFPLTQNGPVTFRYRIMPHGAYDVAMANRFGVEAAQPLVHISTNNNALSKPLVAIEGSASVTVSIIKSTPEAGAVIIRLRSVSPGDETVRLTWPAGIPKMVNVCEKEDVPGIKIKDDVTVPGNGLLTLKAVW